MLDSTTNILTASKCGDQDQKSHLYSPTDRNASARINCVVQIDPTFELEGLPVGENWRGAGESHVMEQSLLLRSLADYDDQAGPVSGQVHTTIREREADVVLLSSSYPRVGLLMTPSRENLSHRVSDRQSN
jgi:hypothetical protein